MLAIKITLSSQVSAWPGTAPNQPGAPAVSGTFVCDTMVIVAIVIGLMQVGLVKPQGEEHQEEAGPELPLHHQEQLQDHLLLLQGDQTLQNVASDIIASPCFISALALTTTPTINTTSSMLSE